MNVCFDSLFSNLLPLLGFKNSSAECATVVATGVVRTEKILLSEDNDEESNRQDH